MAANLTLMYLKAEAKYQAAKTPQEQAKALPVQCQISSP